eukprot:COSAG02_NODE_7731_length_2871_cov_28.438312_3_plen_121_part_00
METKNAVGGLQPTSEKLRRPRTFFQVLRNGVGIPLVSQKVSLDCTSKQYQWPGQEASSQRPGPPGDAQQTQTAQTALQLSPARSVSLSHSYSYSYSLSHARSPARGVYTSRSGGAISEWL